MRKIIVLLISVMLFTSGFMYVNAISNKLVGKVIVIDIGHGGKDSGTVYKDIKEKDINLSIGLKLKKELIKYGVEVIMTREGDYDLSSPNAFRRKKSDFDNRIKLINESNADMYISIHINYLDNAKYYGSQVFYTEDNLELAGVIQSEMIEQLKSPLKERELDNDIYMYKKLDIPGVLIECGYLICKHEAQCLSSRKFQKLVARAIARGTAQYFKDSF